jgi:hypothetical protein
VDSVDAAVMRPERGLNMTNNVTVELESAVGPRVLYQSDVPAEDLEAALPPGWAVDYSTPHVWLLSGVLSASIYQIEP